jgi:hypothetical protein
MKALAKLNKPTETKEVIKPSKIKKILTKVEDENPLDFGLEPSKEKEVTEEEPVSGNQTGTTQEEDILTAEDLKMFSF